MQHCFLSCLGNRAISGGRVGHRNRKSQKSLRFRCAKAQEPSKNYSDELFFWCGFGRCGFCYSDEKSPSKNVLRNTSKNPSKMRTLPGVACSWRAHPRSNPIYCESSRHLQESPGPHSQKSLKKGSFGVSAEKSCKNQKMSKTYPKTVALLGLFRGLFGDFSRERRLNPNIFFSNFSGAAGISRQNPGISRQKSLIPWVSRDIPNFLAPTPSRGRPPPHQKISGLKSLGLGSFFVPDFLQTTKKTLSETFLRFWAWSARRLL